MEETNKNKEQKDDALTAAYMLGRYDGRKEVEAEVTRLQQRVNELLSDELTDGAIRERIQLRLNMHEVLQENERLIKMVDWLAGRCAALSDDGEMENAGFNGTDWKEAARLAVAAEEETCQK